MSLSGGTAGGKGVDSNAVDTYDSGDEWDIGVGNLIIDLDADLEKDKLEMSGTKDGMAAPPSAVAALPDNIRFVSPVSGSQGKESKSKYKRSKNSKDNGSKASSGDGGKKETTGRTQGEPTGTAASAGAAGNNSTSGKNMEKGGKASRGVLSGKKEKDGASGKNKKDKTDGAPVVAITAAEKDVVSQAQVALGNSRNTSFENTQSTDLAEANQMGNIALEPVGIIPALTTKTEPEEVENGNTECKTLKKVKNEKVRFSVYSFDAAWICLALCYIISLTSLCQKKLFIGRHVLQHDPYVSEDYIYMLMNALCSFKYIRLQKFFGNHNKHILI